MLQLTEHGASGLLEGVNNGEDIVGGLDQK
jgi:hypothetical protein